MSDMVWPAAAARPCAQGPARLGPGRVVRVVPPPWRPLTCPSCSYLPRVFLVLPPTCFSSSQEIERLKSEKPTWERRLRWEGMKSVFGGPPSLLWMNPFVGFRFRRLQTRPRKGAPEFSV